FRRRERTGTFRVLGPNLHRPLRADLSDFDCTVPLRVFSGDGSEVVPNPLGIHSRGPREFVHGQGPARAVQGGLHDGALVHSFASPAASGLGPSAGIAKSSSNGRSVFIDNRFTQISPDGKSFCHSLTFSKRPRTSRVMNTVTAPQTLHAGS